MFSAIHKPASSLTSVNFNEFNIMSESGRRKDREGEGKKERELVSE